MRNNIHIRVYASLAIAVIAMSVIAHVNTYAGFLTAVAAFSAFYTHGFYKHASYSEINRMCVDTTLTLTKIISLLAMSSSDQSVIYVDKKSVISVINECNDKMKKYNHNQG